MERDDLILSVVRIVMEEPSSNLGQRTQWRSAARLSVHA